MDDGLVTVCTADGLGQSLCEASIWLLSTNGVLGAWIPLLIGFATVFFTILVNHSTRLNRFKRIHGFSQNFAPRPFAEDTRTDAGSAKDDGTTSDDDWLRRRDIRYSSSLEFVVTKYVTDLDEVLKPNDFDRLKKLDREDDGSSEIEYLVNRIRCYSMPVNRRTLFYALPFMAAITVGWSLALAPTPFLDLFDKTMATPGATQTEPCRFDPTILSLAFLGAYVSVLTMLVRAVSLFDLGPTTFFRALLHVVGAFVAGIIVWNVLLAIFGNDICGGRLSGAFYPFIFAVGFVPDAGLQFVLSSILSAMEAPIKQTKTEQPTEEQAENRLVFPAGLLNFLKLTDGRFARATKSIPLDVIDGVDFFTRFRLSEAGVQEVQNLAVANPILLYVETPYGIYQTIDWVGQAQLCTVVGPERFLMLRQFNIRTVFDLERAVLSIKSTTQLRKIIAGILLMTTNTMRDIEILSGSPFPDMNNPASGAKKTAEEYTRWAIQQASTATKYRFKLARDPAILPAATGGRPIAGYYVWPNAQPAGTRHYAAFEIQNDKRSQIYDIFEMDDDDATIKHMVRVIMDDLHVMRLRQIWESIGRTLGSDAATLDDSEDAFMGA
ncbi:hypothetical protein OSH11_10615 [Kaistia dalseonensis]|uniref:Uncharacterized protein n=1 Tax=Kaistia dalseonensis TaxID=410840 RepID=A0ABU0H6T6_9HYPH|nr:hypothetical protein [Kaistia dalseonensis]MCX5495159.1 hypothetical protein [Kaistia dalseonensis]MDQ0437742.1 hypothetical protein [Kaistia dalseonensis]